MRNTEKIICVTNKALCERPLAEQIKRIEALGITRVILREKEMREEDYKALARELINNFPNMEITPHFFINAARELNFERIHLPLKMLTKEITKEFKTVGVSIHSKEEAKLAESLGASYVTAGHIFATDCKKDLPPRGTDFLREICQTVKIPVCAIGGINENNMEQALNAGAFAVCIMSGLMKI